MTTRAGFTGILNGLITTTVIYLFFYYSLDAFLFQQAENFSIIFWAAAILAAFSFIGGGFLAARWSKAATQKYHLILGGFAGAVSGSLVYCLWGAAAACYGRWYALFQMELHEPFTNIESLNVILVQTCILFLFFFLSGTILGAFGGWISGIHCHTKIEVFNKTDPQMALNTSITAVPSCFLAVAATAVLYKRMTEPFFTGQSEFAILMPLAIAVLLLLASQMVLMLVIPHETRQADHECGMREVRMAAFVAIATAPVFAIIMLIIESSLFTRPLFLLAQAASITMSIKSFLFLLKEIQPRFKSFSIPEGEKKEALWFGTISESNSPRLMKLCAGCGIVMVLPTQIAVLSVLINLQNSSIFTELTGAQTSVDWKVFKVQAITFLGLTAGSILALTLIYLFYLNLGRYFAAKKQKKTGFF